MRHEIVLEGPAYRLRPVTLEDAAFMVELRTDPKLGAYLNPTSPRVEDQESWLRGYFERAGDLYFIIERLTSGRPEGCVALYDIDEEKRCAEWGRWIQRPGSMAATECALHIYRAAFDEVGLTMVYCRTVAENEPVVSFHTSCGLETHARLEGYAKLGDRTFDSIEQRLTVERWPEVRVALERRAAMTARMLNRGSTARHETGRHGKDR